MKVIHLVLLAGVLSCGTAEKKELVNPLFEAIEAGDPAAVEKLTAMGAPLHLRDERSSWLGHAPGELPLEMAVGRTWSEGPESVRIVKLLLERGADPRATDEEGVTLLHLAAAAGNREVVSLLLDRGLAVDARTRAKPRKKKPGGGSRFHGTPHRPLLPSVGRTPLHEAVSRACFEDGGAPNTKRVRGGPRVRLTCDTGAARLLIERGADVNAVDADGNNALVYAASVDSKEFVALLLEQGADAGAVSHYAFSRLIHERLSTAIKRTLISAGASPTDDPLKTAIWRGDLGAVKKLLDGGADPQGDDPHYNKPLHLAVEEGHFDIARELVKRGVSIDQKESAATALHEAAKEKRREAVTFLLGEGANVWERTHLEETPLHAAATGGDVATVKLLLEKGAGINAVDEDGSTPLHHAVRGSNAGVAELLLERGAKLEVKGSWGNTPLHEAARAGNKALAGKLLDLGVKLEERNESGRTPLGEAIDNYHLGTVEFLISRGADSGALSPELRKKLAEVRSYHKGRGGG